MRIQGGGGNYGLTPLESHPSQKSETLQAKTASNLSNFVMTYSGPRGSIYTTIMDLGPQNHNGDGLLGANSIIVVHRDPLGEASFQAVPDILSLQNPIESF